MGFKKMSKTQYPPRHWCLIGYPGAGKSTFATQMKGPILVVDSDHRFAEVAALAPGDIYELSDNPLDNNQSDSIARLLEANMPKSKVGTIIVDSVTAIIQPLVMRAYRDNAANLNTNKAAAYADKATAMRQLQHAVTRWGTDTLWVWHLQEGKDNKAEDVVTQTLPKTERNRLHSSLNLELHVVQEGERRGIKVVWARRGRDGFILWDDSGTWRDMPARIEQSVYSGLSEADQERLENEPPAAFANPEAAIDWAMRMNAFDDFHHAQNAYDKLKRTHQPQTAGQMRDLWVTNVEMRLSQKEEAAHEPA